MTQLAVVASAASTTNGAAAASFAFDGLTGGSGFWWATSYAPQWIRADLGAGNAAVATWYNVTPVVSDTNPPTAWTFEGSNDASAWTTLDTRSSVTYPSGSESRTFTFTNSTAYRYYRLNVSAPTSGAGSLAVLELRIGTGLPRAILWGDRADSMNTLSGSYRIGVVFVPQVDGVITHARGFKIADPSTVTLTLTNTSGTSLGSTTYNQGSLANNNVWYTAAFTTPIAVTAGTAYMIDAYYPNSSGYITGAVSSDIVHGDLKIPAAGSVTFNGSTNNPRYNSGNVYPTLAAGSKHLVGVVFDPTSTTVTGTIAGAAPAAVGSLTGTAPTTGSLAGTAPAAVGSLTGTAPTTGAIAGVGPLGVGALAGTSDNSTTGTLAGVAPLGVGSLTGTAPTTGALAGTGPLGIGSLVGIVTTPAGADTLAGVAPMAVGAIVGDTGTSLDPWVDGAHGDALLAFDAPAGVLEVTYPASVAPAAIVEVSLQRASHQMPALTGVRAMDYPIETDVVGVLHCWVDGTDVTFFRDVPTRISGWRDEAPFAWTGTTLTFPQVFHYEERGVGDLAWMRPDAPVEIAIVRPDGSRLHRFTGQLTSDDPGVGRGRTECVWGVEGVLWQADHVHHPVPARLDPTDVGTLIPRELNGTPSRRFSAIKRVTTGITSKKRGSNGMTRWGHATDLLATAIRTDGKQWTIEPTGPRSFRLALKNTTTVHWTVSAGAPGVELDLSADHHERIDAVYASGVGPDGYAWSNLFFPDLLPYDPPNYPYSDPDHMFGLGSTDAGTLTGEAISLWQRRIRDLGYTAIPVDGVMGSADIAAVRWIQRKRGIQVDGVPGPQTWAATFNVGAIGGDLDTVRLPMAWRTEVEKYLYGANGATVGLNPDYDPSIIRHEIDVDFGAGVTKEQGREMAQRILERGMDPGVAGTIRLTTCPWEGSRWEVNSGQNVLLKGFRGEDILCRIAAVDADPESLTVTLTVDSEFRDAMAVVQVLERNRESKADPARRPGNPNKRSRLDQDMVTPFEGESPAGRLPKMALFHGLWTVWPVPVSEIGEVAKLRFRTTGPASKFCLAMFGRPITANQLDALMPAPLTNSEPWSTHEETLLDRYGWIDTWGKDGQASGYSPKQEGDGSLTGKLTDDAGFPYVSLKAPWIWVAMWSPESCFIEGRIYPSPVQ